MLIGNHETVGESYHIAADRLITWNEMARYLLRALGAEEDNIVHISRADAIRLNSLCSETVNKQHMWHYIFDNSKIRSVVPGWQQKIAFEQGIKMTVNWLMEDDIRRRINSGCREKLTEIYRAVGVVRKR